MATVSGRTWLCDFSDFVILSVVNFWLCDFCDCHVVTLWVLWLCDFSRFVSLWICDFLTLWLLWLPFCHFVTFSLRDFLTFSLCDCHFVTMWLSHFVTFVTVILSLCDFCDFLTLWLLWLILSLCDYPALSLCDFVNLWLLWICDFLTLWLFKFVTLSFSHFVTLWLLWLPFCHFVTFSLRDFLTFSLRDFRDFVNLRPCDCDFGHFVILLLCEFMTLWLSHFVILSFCGFVDFFSLSLSDFVTLWLCYFVSLWLWLCQFVILSVCDSVSNTSNRYPLSVLQAVNLRSDAAPVYAVKPLTRLSVSLLPLSVCATELTYSRTDTSSFRPRTALPFRVVPSSCLSKPLVTRNTASCHQPDRQRSPVLGHAIQWAGYNLGKWGKAFITIFKATGFINQQVKPDSYSVRNIKVKFRYAVPSSSISVALEI